MTSISLPFSILQVLPALETGGVEQTTLDVAEAVAAAGGRALVASAGGRLEAALTGSGARSFLMPLDSKNPLIMATNAERLMRLIRSEGVDLVHVRSRAPAFSALAAARRADIPLVSTYHGIYNAKGPLKRWYNRIMTRGDLVIANSDFTRAHVLAEHGIDPARVVSIPRGVDLRRFDPGAVDPSRVRTLRLAWGVSPSETRMILLLAGRLTRWKGQSLMIEAFAALRDRTGEIPAVLILAGDDQGRTDYREALRAEAAGRGLQDAVRLVGHVSDMPAAYLAADAALAPSLEPEAFGRTAVEPQAMERPVLAADHGAVRETVAHGETGWRAPPGDVQAWSRGLETLIATPPLQRRAMGRLGRDRVKAFYSLEVMTARTLEVYRNLLLGRGG